MRMLRRLAAAILVAPFAAAPALAADWNAMALDRDTLSVGYALDQGSKAEALEKATRACRESGGKRCGESHAREGGCIAISRDADGAHVGLGMNATLEEAIASALDACRDGGKHPSCTVHTNRCGATASG